MIRPGPLKPWLGLQKDLPSNNGSTLDPFSHFSHFNLTHFALDELAAQYPYSIPDLQFKVGNTTRSQNSRSFRVRKSPGRRRQKKKPRQSNTSTMPHNHLSMVVQSASETPQHKPEKTKCFKRILPSSRPYTSINPMIFDNSHSNDEMDIKYVKPIEERIPSSDSLLRHPNSMTEMNWTSPNASFISSKSMETTSLPSSFAMETLDNHHHHGLPCLSPYIQGNQVDGIVSQQPQTLPLQINGSWQWLPPDEVDIWRQGLVPEHPDPEWGMTEDLLNVWQPSESPIASSLIPSSTHTYNPLSTTLPPVFNYGQTEQTSSVIDQKPNPQIQAPVPAPIPKLSLSPTMPRPLSSSIRPQHNHTHTHTHTHTQSQSQSQPHSNPTSSPGLSLSNSSFSTQGYITDHGTPTSTSTSTQPSSSLGIGPGLDLSPESPIKPIASGGGGAFHFSQARNEFLVTCKKRGYSYKDIKRLGGFKEAESTLRGRYRTLTKSKEQRVRKPKWLDNDVCTHHPGNRLGLSPLPRNLSISPIY